MAPNAVTPLLPENRLSAVFWFYPGFDGRGDTIRTRPRRSLRADEVMPRLRLLDSPPTRQQKADLKAGFDMKQLVGETATEKAAYLPDLR